MNTFYRYLGIALAAFILISSSHISDEDIITTIVVIEGKALLVDVDDRGDVIRTYMEVPEYLTTRGTHDKKVREAKASYVRLSKKQMDQIRFISILDINEEHHMIMHQNLADLAAHYHDTYANQIIITVAKSPANEEIINYNVDYIKKSLANKGVNDGDISIVYKVDLGEDPSPFIKVMTGLRKLASL